MKPSPTFFQQILANLLKDPLAIPQRRHSKRRRIFRRQSSKSSEPAAHLGFQPQFPLQQVFFSYLGSFLGIAMLAYLSIMTDYPLIAAPFGATAVLVFAVPNSPLAQPRNVIGGNCLGATIALVCVHAFGSTPWVMALAVATTIKVMQLTRTVHPPGGAVALVGVMSSANWDFFWTPVLVGSVLIVLCTVIFNNCVPGRPYPRHWL